MKKTICELFAGVGGFRLGFDKLNTGWETTWFSQWEPGARTQWAHDCYVQHFGDCPDLNGEYHTGEDIGTVEKSCIPDHSLLVGGFPCQDYSVAHSLASSKGIEGTRHLSRGLRQGLPQGAGGLSPGLCPASQLLPAAGRGRPRLRGVL